MRIVAKNDVADIRDKFPKLLGIAQMALIEGGCDFLGEIAGEAELLNKHGGQFFTPYSLSRMAAEMTLDAVEEIIAERGFVTMQEPAAGAGCMMIAAADALEKKGIDPATSLFIEAIDVSDTAWKMAYIQASLRGIPALVRLGNTLSLEMRDAAYTPAFFPFYSKHKDCFDSWRDGDQHDAEISQSEPEAQKGPPPYHPTEKVKVMPKQLSLFK